MQRIADTGLLKALLDSSDIYHSWAHRQFQIHSPFHTCEAVLDELAHITGDARLGMKLLARGDIIVEFAIRENVGRVLELLEKYSDRPMDFADACVVRMSELTPACRVWTVDREDFKVYRRHGRQPVPCVFPE